MKIFVLGSAVPYRQHNQPGVTAVNIVLYELLNGLNQLGHEVVLQLIFNEYRSTTSLAPSEESELRHLSEIGIEVLSPFGKEHYQKPPNSSPLKRKLRRLVRFLSGRAYVEAFYPAVNARDRVYERVRSARPDAILTIWSPEGVAATYGLSEQKRIAYQGDVDFAPAESRLCDRALFSAKSGQINDGVINKVINGLKQWYWLAEFKRAHLNLMLDLDVIANVTASNAEFYRRRGHHRSVYICNTWSDPGVGWMSCAGSDLKVISSDRPIKIIGHVGFLNRTGSIYGLKFLLVDLMPCLEKTMSGLDYQVHIIGGGEITSTLEPYLQHKRVIVRGFVNNLDQELLSSNMFLMLNNAGSYHAAYTRHLVAWAMGLCLIVHANSKKAIPEITNMENALIGSTPDEVAQMVYLASTNPEVNMRIRQGGRAVYEQYFKPLVVAETLSKEIETIVSCPRTRETGKREIGKANER